MSLVLAFDIGIHNLAFCCLEQTADSLKIRGWDNVSLLTQTSQVSDAKPTCAYCKAKPKYHSGARRVCGKHCPALQPPLSGASGSPAKKIPTVVFLKELLAKHTTDKAPTKKQELLAEVAKYYSMPILEKAKKASQASMEEIHDGIRALITKHQALWSQCTLIGLENQPAFKNPQMKSVQMLLFATLRDLCQPNPPPIQLIHASKKVKGATKGDAGYKERKLGSEERTEKFLKSPKLVEKDRWVQLYQSAKKKNDLADALCMCIDHSSDPAQCV